jgi:thiosulfate reductase / polysulfide reductase chain A
MAKMSSSDSEVKVPRRTVLKATGAAATAGLVTAQARSASAFSLLQPPEVPTVDRDVPSFCELCFWNCGLVAHVRGNRVLSLTGHPDYPNAKGKLCARGNGGAAHLQDPDRLRHPMMRVGRRGEGKFERVGWPVAYKAISEGFKRIIGQYGAKSLALFYHGKGGPLMRRMLVALGSPNYAAPSYAQCKGARDVAYKLTFGEKLSSPEPLDFDATRCMVLFGSHLGENAHNSQVQEFVRALNRGATLIVLDPRFSTAAARATLWLPVRPGTDTAVILAWIHLLIDRGAYHDAFVRKHCVGLEELSNHVRGFTPAWACAESGVPEADIVRAFDLMVAAKPAVLVHPGRHVVWYGEADTQRGRAQAVLSALLGAWWAPGSIFRASSPTLKDPPGPDFPELPLNVDEASGRFPFADEVTTNGIRDATRTDKPYPIKGWFVHGTNLIQAMPNVRETLEAIEHLDMLVVCDIQPTEITRYADVLLPEDMYLERWDDLAVGTGKSPYIGLRQPAVASEHDTRPAWRIAKQLAEQLGVGDYFPFDTFEQYLASRLDGSGIALDDLKAKGIAFTPPKALPYLDPNDDFHWHTPSGKIELYSKQLADRGFAPLPSYVAPSAGPPGMLRLLYGRSPVHSFGRTQNNSILADVDPTNCVWIHPDDASRLGVMEGASVMVSNATGDATGPVRAKVTQRIAVGCVYMVHGFGQRSKALRTACGKGASDSDLIAHYAVDPISGTTGMRTEFVTVSRAPAGKELDACVSEC